MPEDTIVVYATDWCFDCRRARRFLDQNHIDYRWVNIDKDKEGEKIVKAMNHGMRSVPTMVFPDGSVLVEPSDNHLAQKFGVPA